MSQLVAAISEVVALEAPILIEELATRVAGLWGSRAGPRKQARIQQACESAERSGALQRRGDFLWSLDGTCRLRSRSGTRIGANRIAPEEYAEAILAVLGTGFGFSRTHLIQEVRGVLGFSRTGALLDEAIGAAIDHLAQEGRLGDGSNGIRLREILEDLPSGEPVPA